ncbi:MAG: hypothetical protein EBU08_14620 [Micrococcales bacterium]|nr:hypothetical protein [Micrococcales bacterium]
MILNKRDANPVFYPMTMDALIAQVNDPLFPISHAAFKVWVSELDIAWDGVRCFTPEESIDILRYIIEAKQDCFRSFERECENDMDYIEYMAGVLEKQRAAEAQAAEKQASTTDPVSSDAEALYAFYKTLNADMLTGILYAPNVPLWVVKEQLNNEDLGVRLLAQTRLFEMTMEGQK